MSFDINIMKFNSEKISLTKSMTTLKTVTGTLKESTSIIDPVIKVEVQLAELSDCNYLYIANFHRYYYVNTIISITDDIQELHFHCDVLNSFKSEIRNNFAIIRRQEDKWNLYLNDGAFRVYADPDIVTKPFPSGFSTQEFVLAVAGSAGASGS